MELKTLQAEVKSILTDYPKTRDSNELLYGRYLQNHGVTMVTVNTFFNRFTDYKVASFESVTRCRRKIAEEHPELGASPEVQELRDERQLEMFGFSKGRSN